jgi:putative endonuclease
MKDNKLYTGYTTNLQQRIEHHNSGSVPSTKERRPFRLIFFEGYTDKGDALRRESYLKTNEGKKMLRRMLRNHFASHGDDTL